MSWLSQVIDKVLPGAPAHKFTQNTYDKLIKPEDKDTVEALATAVAAPALSAELLPFLSNAVGSQGLANTLLSGLQSAATGGNPLTAMGNSIFSENIPSGTLDDTLRQWLSNSLGMNLDSFKGLSLPTNIVSTGTGSIYDILGQLLGKYLGTGNSTGTTMAAPVYNLPDIMSIYNQYYNQLGGGAPDYTAAANQQLDALRQQMAQDQARQSSLLDSSLNRRGLYSSGIALNEQNLLRQQFADAMAKAVSSSATNVSNLLQQSEANRRQQALDMAKQTIAEAMKYPGSYAAPATQMTLPYSFPDVLYTTANPSTVYMSGTPATANGTAQQDMPRSLPATAPQGSQNLTAPDGAVSYFSLADPLAEENSLLFSDKLQKTRQTPHFVYNSGSAAYGNTPVFK